ncbi:MAG: enoyl-CoA hydratase/isomerase family protein [Alphaproteobacteria bacterium]|nr:enoyl-CoA hydratase/isomerase family protein [Alphaproteobacteria bacterium]
MSNGPVSLTVRGGCAHVVVDNPPVNALSRDVRAGIETAMRAALADRSADCIVIRAAGRTFVAGGDIGEFDGPLLPPDMNDVVALVETSDKPVVAALHGTVLGGGLELALGCHARVAASETRLGLPEVTLGLIPGAGGTRRLPRAIGLRKALDMIVEGAPIRAGEARTLGLVDEIVDGDLPAAAETLARSLVGTDLAPRRLGSAARATAGEDVDAILAAARARVAQSWPWSTARRAAIESVAQGVDNELDAALARERALFEQCRAGGESKALIHMFFAERDAVRVPAWAAAANAMPIARVGVVGGGTMGRGIAIVFAAAGIPTLLHDSNPAARAAARVGIDAHFKSQAERGRLAPEAAQAAAAAATIVDSLDAFAPVDLVVEAAFEQMAVKLEVFRQLDRVTRPDAVLATNTSTLDVEAIARATGRPDNVLGMHFFSPAPVMRLLEIVRTPLTGASALRSVVDLSRRIGKTGIVVGNAFGFVANRMIFEYQRQGEFLVEEGASPEQVDRVLVEFGMPMGPFAMADMAGLDVAWFLRKEIPQMRPAGRRYSALADHICERGWFGQKTGRGWFRYEAGGRKPLPHPEVDALVDAERRRLGLSPRTVADEEIRERCLFALVNEAARLLDEGLAARPGDIDVIYAQGFGFPRWRGGPLHWADAIGVAHVHRRVEAYHDAGDPWLQPAPLLARMAAEGVKFSELERKAWIRR